MDFLLIEISAIIILIGLYALFSGLEIAIVGIRRSKVMRLYRKKIRGSSALYKLKSNPSMMTSSVNLGNTLVNVASSVLAADVAIKMLGNQGVGIAIGIMTFIILVFGEIFPKTYSHIQSEKMALRFSNFLLAFTYLMYPFVWFLDKLTKSFLKLIGGQSYPKPITEEDIQEVVDLGLSEKAIEKEEHRLVKKALEFDDKPIIDVMTPKNDIFSLDDEILLSEVFSLIVTKGFSRIPVYSKTFENIIGILHIWDIAKIPENKFAKIKVGKIMRTPFFVYSDEKISALLVELKKNESHMAVVLDDNENLQGIITIEDLLEEIVGDIGGDIR
ncbi:hemolysin family protein [Nitrosopumilus sp. b2]|uniref:hemolysin family protein n=1 Tax=Nitrosopumilus sp. b2 TaxID=2109908 RepID=UPI0015F727B0|nr:hemolysin family protein [Nitrosopumilus sp. b2]KAF6244787.1 hemolysin [Nitrosopumilus sp. b2]